MQHLYRSGRWSEGVEPLGRKGEVPGYRRARAVGCIFSPCVKS